ncbi:MULTISPECIES: hemolysin family protein [Agromyces]|uniref:Membrane protein n=1 Tax=Agromyces mediolanus TaxID=41986 RepID=A0A918KVW9_AGRME|nr:MULTISPECIES: hemolysin family protein [Agromyces]MCD1572191.1 hemolysin family protein [Agromyces mediolanus]GGR36108.1 membrane protein [Agromyces mediolanus]GLJ72856.1 membrane protein [Agromyces mediolanus]GLU90196.1 membrane protein [Agromyces sp. NBRC 114283]
MEPWYFLVAAFVLVAFGGLMAAVDSAIASSSRADIAELAEGARAKRSLTAIAEDTGAHVNAVNFMRILAETTAAVLVTLAFASFLDNPWLVLLWSALIMTAVSFVLVGASPRSVGRVHAPVVLRLTAPLVHFLRVLLGPLAGALVQLGNRVTPGRIRFAGVSSEEQLLSMVDEATELDVLEEGDRELIHSIFEFNDTVVREVMVPRTDMITIDATAHLQQAMSVFLSAGYSRIPVIGLDSDDVTGILYLRDLAKLGFERPLDAESLTVGQLARPAEFVPDSMKADALLRQMQTTSNHLAMVVDEYGGIAGLATMEDLIEELVGDISDEYDRETPEVEALGDGRYRVSARLAIDELGELFGLELDDDDVDTVGGLLAKALGRLPQRGDRASTSGLELEAERTEGRRRRISTVLVSADAALIDATAAFLGDAEQEPHRD